MVGEASLLHHQAQTKKAMFESALAAVERFLQLNGERHDSVRTCQGDEALVKAMDDKIHKRFHNEYVKPLGSQLGTTVPAPIPTPVAPPTPARIIQDAPP
jgi:hypothetical protein